MTRLNPYDQGLDKNAANFVALSPLSYIERAALTLLSDDVLSGWVQQRLDARVRHFHGIWHLFVIAGSLMHYIAILGYVLPASS